MKIKVRGYLTLKRAMGDIAFLEIEKENATIKGVLDDLCHKFGREFTELIFESGTGEVSAHLRILVNGRHFISIPNQLDNELMEGDELGLFPLLAGG